MHSSEALSQAENFLKYNYPETKDMCLHFLTLVTAVLVFSLSFAEKVFDFRNASPGKRLVIIIGWCAFLISIILCGLGLTFIALAGGAAVYNSNFKGYEALSYNFIIGGGLCFILGLIFTMLSAIISRNAVLKSDN